MASFFEGFVEKNTEEPVPAKVIKELSKGLPEGYTYRYDEANSEEGD